MKTLAVVLLIALAGCASRAEREAELARMDNAECAKRGFTPDTDPFRICLLQLANARETRRQFVIWSD